MHDLCTVKTFTSTIERTGYRKTISYDIQIPLPDNSKPLEFFGHLCVQQNVPLFAQKEIQNALTDFIWVETDKLTTEYCNNLIQKRLAECDYNAAKLTYEISTRMFQSNVSAQQNDENSPELPPFEEQFQQVMRKCTPAQLAHLIREEADMTEDMRAFVQVRDSELNRLEKECESILISSSKSDNDFDKHSHQLSQLNTEIRQITANFSSQLEALQRDQRQYYRELVRKLFSNEQIEEEMNGSRQIASSKSLHNIPSDKFGGLSLQTQSSSNVKNGHSTKGMFKKSASCDEKLANASMNGSKLDSNYSECFSIYIGSQLKTMHNARILSCHRLSDLCISPTSEDFEQHSKRLHLLMSLYGRELSAVVLLVGRDPYWHIKNRTAFSQLCEQSVELHFDSLAMQLKQIEEKVRTANRNRRQRQPDHLELYSPDSSHVLSENGGDENQLQAGDVYVTRHSNLSAVQLVFHLVTNSALEEQEISSRHPCIGGLHNIVRMIVRYAIRDITLPLLLVEEPKEDLLRNGWCMGRAELVFKCLKGFLMEVCCSGSNSSMASTTGTGPIQQLHFNINFALPSAISHQMFRQIVDLFTSIYYLVPSLNA